MFNFFVSEDTADETEAAETAETADNEEVKSEDENVSEITSDVQWLNFTKDHDLGYSQN